MKPPSDVLHLLFSHYCLADPIQVSVESGVMIDETFLFKTLVQQIDLFQKIQIGFAELECFVCW